MSLLGIDIGSSSCKGVAFDQEGRTLAMASRQYATTSPAPGRMEIDAGQFWQAVVEVTRELSGALAKDPIAALSISSHGETIVPLDRAGAPAGPAIMNSDQRAVAQAERMERKLGRREIYRLTGLPVHTIYGLNKILWLRENEPDYFASIDRFVSVGAFILRQMGFEPLSDYSLASRTMAFDIHTTSWSETILDCADLSPDRLDLLRPAGEKAGTLSAGAASRLGLNPGTAVVIGGHDQPCGALGAGIIEPGQVCDSAGTYECMVAASTTPGNSDRALANHLNSYCHVVPGRYVTLAFFPGGIASQWFIDQFCGEDRLQAEQEGRTVHEVLAARVRERAPGPTGVCVTPHLVGACNPHWDVNARGAIAGLSLATTRHHLYKAIFEGLACELSLNVSALEAAVGRIGGIRIFGGNARSEFTVQLRADITGHDMVMLDTSEAVCRGAAMLAGLGIGIYKDAREAVAQAVHTGAVISSSPQGTALYAKQLERYKTLYPALHKREKSCLD